MTPDFANTRNRLEQLNTDGLAYFAALDGWPRNNRIYGNHEADYYWSKLDEKNQQTSFKLQAELIQVIKTITNCIKQASLLTEADRRDLGTWTKSLRASLRLRRYAAWDMEVMHDEGAVLGVRPAGQSDTEPAHPEEARLNFQQIISNLRGLVDLLDISPTIATDAFRANPQATTEYEPDTAFVMMQIDPQKSELEDRYNTIKDCFAKFGIAAVRADEIEHADVITEKIREKIRSSEFLIADLTGERPSVYYEVGYAHALRRKVIMYRFGGSPLHFDLAAYNCPEYSNLTDLKRKLMRRLQGMTNSRPKNGSP